MLVRLKNTIADIFNDPEIVHYLWVSLYLVRYL